MPFCIRGVKVVTVFQGDLERNGFLSSLWWVFSFDGMGDFEKMAELILKLKEREIKRISINKSEVTIGRDLDSDLCIDNIGISRIHSTIRFELGRFTLRDNGSSNGTFVNGQQVDTHELVDGDQIQIGKYKISFSIMGQVPTSLSEPAPSKEETSGKKKPKDVFGTVQFSADDIQKLMSEKNKLMSGPDLKNRLTSSSKDDLAEVSTSDKSSNSLEQKK